MFLLFAARGLITSMGRFFLMAIALFMAFSWITGLSWSWWPFQPKLPSQATTAAEISTTITGKGRVFGSDRLVLDDRLIRLWGVDAMERNQGCATPEGRTPTCGTIPEKLLRTALQQGEVACTVIEVDAWNRAVARCSVDGQDLGAMLVEAGYALSTPEHAGPYALEEERARAAKTGIWAGHFMQPWNVRRPQDPF